MGRRRAGVSEGDVSPIDEDFEEVPVEPNYARQTVPQVYHGGSRQITESPVSPLEPERKLKSLKNSLRTPANQLQR